MWNRGGTNLILKRNIYPCLSHVYTKNDLIFGVHKSQKGLIIENKLSMTIRLLHKQNSPL